MRRFAAILSLSWLFLAPILAWSSGVANNPQSPISPLQQGPDPTGNAGYPLSVVNATGTTLDVNVASGGGGSVTQGTTPWIVSQDFTCDPWRVVRDHNGVSGPIQTEAGGAGNLTPTDVVPVHMIFPDNTQVWQSAHGVSEGETGRKNATVAPFLSGSGNNTEFSMVRERTPDVFKTIATAALGNTALWTPAANKKFRLMRYMVTIVDQATQAAPGTLTVSLLDGAAGATGQVHDVFVPAVGLLNTGSLYTSGWIDVGNGYLSTVANNVLNVNLSAPLTAGTVRVICCGTEE